MKHLTPEQVAVLDLLRRIDQIESDIRDLRAELSGLAAFVRYDHSRLPAESEFTKLR